MKKIQTPHVLLLSSLFNPQDVISKKELLLRIRRLCQLISFAAFVIVMVVAAANVSVQLVRINQAPKSASFAEIQQDAQSIIEEFIGTKLLQDSQYPYAMARDWIIITDPLHVTPADATFLQRYVAAYFYFATTQVGSWSHCGNSSDQTQSPMCSMPVFQSPTCSMPPVNKQTYKISISWLSSNSECNWAGIKCDRNRQIIALTFGASHFSL